MTYITMLRIAGSTRAAITNPIRGQRRCRTTMPYERNKRSSFSRLLKRVGTIESDLKRSHDRDWNEQAIELENDEVLEGLDEMTQGEVRRIRAAISRIANGTYGVCSTCGHPISAERLAAIPGALTCVTCSTEQPRST